MSFEDLLAQFPEDKVSGEWMPLFIEPTPGTGERLTCAIAALTYEGDMKIHRLLSNDKLKCFYGAHRAKAISHMINITEDHLTFHWDKHETFEGFNPLFSSALPGKIHHSGGTNIHDLINQGVMLYSGVDYLSNDDIDEQDENQQQLITQIKDEMRRLKPSLLEHINKKVPIERYNRPLQFGFFNSRLAANFSNISTSNIHSIESKILHLDDVRMDRMLTPGRLAMFVNIKIETRTFMTGNQKYRNRIETALADIGMRCRERDIKFFRTESPESICKTVIELAA